MRAWSTIQQVINFPLSSNHGNAHLQLEQLITFAKGSLITTATRNYTQLVV
jgi:hypothetical protein